MTKVTKEKHPGRVQAGKRLHEWNKSHKENLKKKIEELETRLESTKKEPDISTLKEPQISTSKEPEISTLKELGYKLTSIILLITSISTVRLYFIFKKSQHINKNYINKKSSGRGKANE